METSPENDHLERHSTSTSSFWALAGSVVGPQRDPAMVSPSSFLQKECGLAEGSARQVAKRRGLGEIAAIYSIN